MGILPPNVDDVNENEVVFVVVATPAEQQMVRDGFDVVLAS
jgi:hypothetical protein